jgi:diguanylate cyclase (GGDEF)-like protein
LESNPAADKKFNCAGCSRLIECFQMARRPPPKKKPATARGLDARLRALEEENRRLRASPAAAIGRITGEFNTLDLDLMVETAVRRISELVHARLGSIYLYDYEAQELVLASRVHPRAISERISLETHRDSVMDRVLRSRAPIAVHGFAGWTAANPPALERPFASSYATETCLSVPLLTANYAVGVLNLADREDGGPFDPDTELPAVEQLCRVLAMAIRNCKLFKEVQNQARTDALTGLRNYRAFHETLRTEIHRSQRYHRPLGLISLDIDSFKEINDRFGHPAGDAALAELGKVIRAATRREDFSARTGGDEIAILLPETGEEGSLSVVRRLIQAVRAHAFEFQGRRLPLSISVGVAFFRPDMTVAQMVGAADQALYKAKLGGKDRFETADEPTSSPPPAPPDPTPAPSRRAKK